MTYLHNLIYVLIYLFIYLFFYFSLLKHSEAFPRLIQHSVNLLAPVSFQGFFFSKKKKKKSSIHEEIKNSASS